MALRSTSPTAPRHRTARLPPSEAIGPRIRCTRAAAPQGQISTSLCVGCGPVLDDEATRERNRLPRERANLTRANQAWSDRLGSKPALPISLARMTAYGAKASLGTEWGWSAVPPVADFRSALGNGSSSGPKSANSRANPDYFGADARKRVAAVWKGRLQCFARLCGSHPI
jgi:hypothetical protein